MKKILVFVLSIVALFFCVAHAEDNWDYTQKIFDAVALNSKIVNNDNVMTFSIQTALKYQANYEDEYKQDSVSILFQPSGDSLYVYIVYTDPNHKGEYLLGQFNVEDFNAAMLMLTSKYDFNVFSIDIISGESIIQQVYIYGLDEEVVKMANEIQDDVLYIESSAMALYMCGYYTHMLE